MRVKLSKIIKDLNVGQQTIKDFFEKKKIDIEVTPNTKIDEDVLEILIKEFKPDMEQKLKSEYLTNARQKEKEKIKAAEEEAAAAKQAAEPVKTEIEMRKPKVVGKIDLEKSGKKAKKQEKPVEKEKPEPPKAKVPKPSRGVMLDTESSISIK